MLKKKLGKDIKDGFIPLEAGRRRRPTVAFGNSLAGFTLIEMMMVVILIGLLASIAWPRYIRTVERGRAAEAKHNLGLIRDAELAYYLEWDRYTTDLAAIQQDSLPDSCNVDFYFYYHVSVSGATFTAKAERCAAGGKPPNYAGYYILNMTDTGSLNGTAGFI